MRSKEEIEVEVRRLIEGSLQGDRAAIEFLKGSSMDLESIKRITMADVGFIRANVRLLSLHWVMEDHEASKSTIESISAAEKNIEKILDYLVKKC